MAKLKWEYDKKERQHSSGYFVVDVSPFRTKNYSLSTYLSASKTGTHIGVFKTLSRAKNIAQLIHNG